MGNISPERMSSSSISQESHQENFTFHDRFTEDSNNGLFLNNVYLPEEVVIMILSYVEPKEILKATLVCKRWCNLIKSDQFWTARYSREYNTKPKRLPWYVYYCLFTTNYFNKNLIKNGNGQDGYKNWIIMLKNGDGFRIENPPNGADPLPLYVPEFNGKTSCFATSYGECNKYQLISFQNNKLMKFILSKYKPHIYLSEWVAGRFDCGCVYTLCCKLYGKNTLGESSLRKSKQNQLPRYRRDLLNIDLLDNEPDEPLHVQKTGLKVEQWGGSTWAKLEFVVKDYPEDVNRIIFQHQGMDTQFWKGYYGSKMAGGVLKILFETIEPSD